MSKERLEAIRHYYREMESFDTGTQSDINWLIEQAERVQELEEENISLKAIKAGNEELIKILEQQNKRYREALEHIERIQSVDVAQQIARQAFEG